MSTAVIGSVSIGITAGFVFYFFSIRKSVENLSQQRRWSVVLASSIACFIANCFVLTDGQHWLLVFPFAAVWFALYSLEQTTVGTQHDARTRNTVA